jgi:hypothetical protein
MVLEISSPATAEITWVAAAVIMRAAMILAVKPTVMTLSWGMVLPIAPSTTTMSSTMPVTGAATRMPSSKPEVRTPVKSVRGVCPGPMPPRGTRAKVDATARNMVSNPSVAMNAPAPR